MNIGRLNALVKSGLVHPYETSLIKFGHDLVLVFPVGNIDITLFDHVEVLASQ